MRRRPLLKWEMAMARQQDFGLIVGGTLLNSASPISRAADFGSVAVQTLG